MALTAEFFIHEALQLGRLDLHLQGVKSNELNYIVLRY